MHSGQRTRDQIYKFAVVGIINTTLDVAVLNALAYLTGSRQGAGIFGLNSIAYGAALLNSYFLNKYWTFLDRSQKHMVLKFSEFVLVNIMGLILNSSIVTLVTTCINPMFGLDSAAWLNVAKLCIATPCVMVFNFLSYKYWVFHAGPSRASAFIKFLRNTVTGAKPPEPEDSELDRSGEPKQP